MPVEGHSVGVKERVWRVSRAFDAEEELTVEIEALHAIVQATDENAVSLVDGDSDWPDGKGEFPKLVGTESSGLVVLGPPLCEPGAFGRESLYPALCSFGGIAAIQAIAS